MIEFSNKCLLRAKLKQIQLQPMETKNMATGQMTDSNRTEFAIGQDQLLSHIFHDTIGKWGRQHANDGVAM